jgi:hypothetical protein
LLIGSLLVLTGVGLVVLMGWAVEAARRTMADENARLPDFDNLAEYALDGLKVFAWGLVWVLPLVIIIVVVAVGGVMLGANSADPDAGAMLVVVSNICAAGLAMVYALALTLLYGPALGILAETGSLAEMLKPGAAVRLFRAKPGSFLMATLMYYLASIVLGFAGALLCMIGIYPANVILLGFHGQVFGKAYKEAKAAAASTPAA